MIEFFRAFLGRWFGQLPVDLEDSLKREAIYSGDAAPPPPSFLGDSFKADLLECSRTQWQLGDWERLAQIDVQTLNRHPDRAVIALLVASAHQQLNDQDLARQFYSYAERWGCNINIMARIMVSSVYNTLGYAMSILDDETRADRCFRQAVEAIGGDSSLLAPIRTKRELERLQQYKVLSGNTMLFQQGSMEQEPVGGRVGIISYAQNFEDVMLWRALGHIPEGFYLDIGANDPLVDSVSRAFYEQGWRGIHVEPLPDCAEMLRQNRPDELVIESAVGTKPDNMEFFTFSHTGISTGVTALAQKHVERGFILQKTITTKTIRLGEVFAYAEGRDIHWMKIDVEGMERDVLLSWGESTARPWVVIIEACKPFTNIQNHKEWEYLLIHHGYKKAYFDGLNNFYVSSQHLELASAFQHGPCILDEFKLSSTAIKKFIHGKDT